MKYQTFLNVSAVGALTLLAACDSSHESRSDDRSGSRSTNHSDSNRNEYVRGNNPNHRSDLTRNPNGSNESYQWEGNERVSSDVRRTLSNENNMNSDVQNWRIQTDRAGVVTLQGSVANQAEKDRMESRARTVSGVTGVDNQLAVRGS